MDTCNDKRQSGGDNFQVQIQSEDGTKTGRSRIVDLGTGVYHVFYIAPTAGPYLVHVSHQDLGDEHCTPIRGSPYKVQCKDPWTQHRVVGAIPAKRKGATMRLVKGELVIWGGDKSDVVTCVVADSEWKWVAPTIIGVAPAARGFCTATVHHQAAVVYFGGLGLADNSEMNDVAVLLRTDAGWEWKVPQEVKGYLKVPEVPEEVRAWLRG